MGGDNDARMLSTGTFARRSRLSLKALRLYDSNGLLPPARVDEYTGYRWYHEHQLATARLIVMLRGLDMPLPQVAEIVGTDAQQAAERLDAYWNEGERRRAGQRELAHHVRAKLLGADTTMTDFEVRERDVPHQRVLSEQSHVRAAHLSAWIGRTMGKLLAQADELGGVTGHPFVVYHGDIDYDGDGPAEACVPIDPTSKAGRDEQAHREVYVRLRKARVGFPQIISVFDGLSQWVDTSGRETVGPPREVYFADFVSAQPTDEVCDVAIPVR